MSDIGDRIRALAQHTPAGERILPPAHDLEALAAQADDLEAMRQDAWRQYEEQHARTEKAEALAKQWYGEKAVAEVKRDAALAKVERVRGSYDHAYDAREGWFSEGYRIREKQVRAALADDTAQEGP